MVSIPFSKKKHHLTGIDWILHGFDCMNKRATGAGNAFQIVMELEGAPAEAEVRKSLDRFVGNPTPRGQKPVWGLGDSILQSFIAPHLKGRWDFGLGPQISFAGILAQHWSFDGEFSKMILHPMLFYDFDFLPGA